MGWGPGKRIGRCLGQASLEAYSVCKRSGLVIRVFTVSAQRTVCIDDQPLLEGLKSSS